MRKKAINAVRATNSETKQAIAILEDKLVENARPAGAEIGLQGLAGEAAAAVCRYCGIQLLSRERESVARFPSWGPVCFDCLSELYGVLDEETYGEV